MEVLTYGNEAVPEVVIAGETSDGLGFVLFASLFLSLQAVAHNEVSVEQNPLPTTWGGATMPAQQVAVYRGTL